MTNITLLSLHHHRLDLADENLKAEVERTEATHAKMMDLKRDLMKRDMAIHNMEQDNIRLQSLLDSISLIHPGTTKQLKRIEAAKRFQDRGFTALAQIGVARKYEGHKDPRELEPLTSNSPLKRLPEPVRRRPLSARPLGRYAGQPMGEGEDPVAFLMPSSSSSGTAFPSTRRPKTNIALMDRSEAGVVLRAQWAADRLGELQEKIGAIELAVQDASEVGQNEEKVGDGGEDSKEASGKEEVGSGDAGDGTKDKDENEEEAQRLVVEEAEASQGALARRLGNVLQFIISGSIEGMIGDPYFPIKIERPGDSAVASEGEGSSAAADDEGEETKRARGEEEESGEGGGGGAVKGSGVLGSPGSPGSPGVEEAAAAAATAAAAVAAAQPRAFALRTAIRDNKTWGSFLSRLVMDYPVGHIGNLNTRDLITERVAKSQRKMEKNRAERAKGAAHRLNVFSATSGV